MSKQNKILEFLYEQSQIHFLITGSGENVMINATEMARLFNRKTEVFLKTDTTKVFIEELNRPPIGGRIIENRGRNGVYFTRILALKFAAWLNPKFERWVFETIEKVKFGFYKEHWDFYITQENAKNKMDKLREELKIKITEDKVIEFFEAESDYRAAKLGKNKAIRNQMNMFDNQMN